MPKLHARVRTSVLRWRAALSAEGWIVPFFQQYRKALLASLCLGVAALVFAYGLMFTAGYLIDLSAEQPEAGVWSLFVPLAFVQLFGLGKPFLSYAERLKSHDWVLRMTSQMRLRLFKSIDAGGVFWTATHGAGKALGLLSEDIGHVQDLYLRCIFPQVSACVCWLLLSVWFGVFSVPMGLCAACALSVLVFVVPVVAALANAARRQRLSHMRARAYEQTYDQVAGVADWLFSQRQHECVESIMDARAQRVACSHELAAAARRRELLVQVCCCVFSVAVLVWAASQFGMAEQPLAAGSGTARPADWVAAFVLGFFPLVEAFAPLSDAAVLAQAQLGAVERLAALDTRPEGIAPDAAGDGACSADVQPPHSCEIVLENLHFSYADRAGTLATHLGAETLRGVNMRIAPGEKLLVLGPSGAGKSTLLSLIRGDLAPTGGRALLGGVPTAALGNLVTQYMGVIQQDTYLFNQTLFENLALGNPDVGEDDVRRALRQVGLGALLERLPQGLHTLVDEGGMRFSGGERHRIALARILLQDTSIVLLDEPCAGLDPITEAALLDTVFDALADRTVIMVTHHLLGATHADRVVFVEEGAIALEGSPAQLERTSERYRKLLAFDRGL